jgi:hypothetical protein
VVVVAAGAAAAEVIEEGVAYSFTFCETSSVVVLTYHINSDYLVTLSEITTYQHKAVRKDIFSQE